MKGKPMMKPMMKKGEHMMGNMPMKDADMGKMHKEYAKPAKKSGKK